VTDSKHVTRSNGNSRRRRRVLVSAAGAIAIVVAGLALYAYLQLSSARDDVDAARANARELQTALESGDQAAAERSLSSLQHSIGDADSTVGGAIFSVAAKLPVLGKNVDAVRTVTSSLSQVADTGLPPLVAIADQFNGKTFNPVGGAINVDAIAAIGPNVTEAADVIGKASAEIDAVDASTLVGSLRDPVVDLQDQLGHAAEVAQRASIASEVAPKMLSGKHTYLLMFQNNAEIRATGGLPGAYAVLTVDNGSIKLGQQGTGSSFPEQSEPVVPLTDEEEGLFDTKLGTFFLDTNFTPDFPRTAEIASTFLKKVKGIDVDGVMSVDPVALSYVLEGLGPITLEDDSTLSSSNAVDVLLNGVYVTYADPDTQDAYFASATQKIFDKVLAGAGDPTAVLKALTRATDERRVQLWTKDADISAALDGTPLAAQLPVGKAAESTLGVYLNDATGAKMQYYLDYDVDARATKCSDAGAQTYETVTTLKSNAPADSANLPESIRGPGFGAPPGAMFVNTYVYAPDGGKVTELTIDGEKTFSFPGSQSGRGVEFVTVQLDPGQTVTVEATVVSGDGQRGTSRVLATPGVAPGSKGSTVKSAC